MNCTLFSMTLKRLQKVLRSKIEVNIENTQAKTIRIQFKHKNAKFHFRFDLNAGIRV